MVCLEIGFTTLEESESRELNVVFLLLSHYLNMVLMILIAPPHVTLNTLLNGLPKIYHASKNCVLAKNINHDGLMFSWAGVTLSWPSLSRTLKGPKEGFEIMKVGNNKHYFRTLKGQKEKFEIMKVKGRKEKFEIMKVQNNKSYFRTLKGRKEKFEIMRVRNNKRYFRIVKGPEKSEIMKVRNNKRLEKKFEIIIVRYGERYLTYRVIGAIKKTKSKI